MRYEAKHSYFKSFSSRTSFKNVALSLARHHQRWMASNVASAQENKSFFKTEFECSKKAKQLQVCELDHCGKLLMGKKDSVTPRTVVTVCPWIKVNGTLYKEGYLVARGVHEDLPLFGRVKQIVCAEAGAIFLYLQPINTNGLENHLNAYSVQHIENARNVLIMQRDLLTHEPVQELKFEGGDYVILRRSVQASMDDTQ